ncbi:two-partner secretion domain-containing protein [Bordetella trematum]|uniref:two-partner secretion domain-containing protein n=1 Tax=Bordetella trematum TaxID=123899 RepID=UPI0015C544DF|nr:hemagglutinin repeat-containing protein [Bordetella trematum]
MNTKLYRLVFNKVRGMYVPIAEVNAVGCKKSGRRARRGMAALFRLAGLSRAMLGAFGLAAIAPAFAQIVTDGREGPDVSKSASGVPLININAPNAQGLSHNKFKQFDTSNPGAVFNNSLVDGRSHIAGQVSKNPRLGGRMATGILAEVTGTQSSRLQGTLEVFGGPSHLFIANPNGITADGLSTYNATGLTLTSGRPWLNDGKMGFQVEGGRITVGAGGVNTDGLKTFDMIAKLIRVEGPVAHTGEGKGAALLAVAGTGRFDAATGKRLSDDGGAGSAEAVSGYAIDGAAAGSMYGSSVMLVATDSGMGVRLPGSLSAPENLFIDAAGNITLGTARSGDAVLRAGDSIDGRLVLATGQVDAEARRNLSLATANGRNLALTAGKNLTVGAAATTHGLQAKAGGDVWAGLLQADGGVDIDGGRRVEIKELQADDGAARLRAGTDLNIGYLQLGPAESAAGARATAGKPAAGGTEVLLQAGRGSIKLDQANLTARRGLKVVAGKDLLLGDLAIAEKLTALAGQGIAINNLRADGAVLKAGEMPPAPRRRARRSAEPSAEAAPASGGDVTLGAADIGAGGMDVSGGSRLLMGRVSSSGNLNMWTSGPASIEALTVSGDVNLATRTGDIWLGTDKPSTEGGSTVSGKLALTAGPDGDLIFINKDISAKQIVLQGNNAIISKAVLEATGEDLSAGQPAVDVQIKNALLLQGDLYALVGDDKQDGAVIRKVKHRPVAYRIGEDGKESVIAGTVIASDAGLLAAKGDVVIKGKDVSNAGGMIASKQGHTKLELGGKLDNQGVMNAREALAVKANEVSNQLAMRSYGVVSVQATKALNNTGVIAALPEEGATQSSRSNSVSLSSDGAIDNDGEVSSTGTVSMGGIAAAGGAQAGSTSRPVITNSENSVINGLSYMASGKAVSNLGKLTLFGDGGAKIVADEKVKLAGDIDITKNLAGASGSGARSQGGNLDVQARDLEANGKIAVSGSITLTLQDAAQLGTGSDIKGKMLTVAAKSLSNEGTVGLLGKAEVTAQEDIVNKGKLQASNLSLTGKNISNLGGSAVLHAIKSVTLTSTEGEVRNEGEVKGKSLTLKARVLDNQVSGKMAVTDGTIDVTEALRNAGKIQATHDIKATTRDYANTGIFSAGNDLTLNITNAGGLTLDEARQAPLANRLLTIDTPSLRVKSDLQNPGKIVLNITDSDLNNDSVIATPKQLSLKIKGKVNNQAGALMWSGTGIDISATDIGNQADAWMLTQDGNIELVAKNGVRNHSGRIEAKQDLIVDAPTIENLSTLSGNVWVSESAKEKVTTSDSLGYWTVGRWRHTEIYGFDVRKPEADLSVKQGVMRAGGNVEINQKSKPGAATPTVRNQGIMLADGTLKVKGNISNESLYRPLGLMDYLKMNTGAYDTWVQDKGAIAHGDLVKHGSLYNMLEFILGNDKRERNLWWYRYNLTDSLGPVLAAANMSQAPLLNRVMANVLGADWRGLKPAEMAKRWGEFKAGTRGATLDFYPASQTVMAGRKGVDLTGGSVSMGSNSSQDAHKARLEGTRPQVAQIGQVEVPIIDGTLDASFALGSGVAAIDPALRSLLGNRLLFVRGGAKDKPGAASQAEQAPKARRARRDLLAEADAEQKAVVPKPIYETRLKYIDQNNYYGSDYFFKLMKYHPQKGLYVSGDNYFDSMLVREMYERLLGGAQGRMGSSGAQGVKVLMDNGGEESKRLGLTVGTPLTKEQIAGLQKDIVWYELQDVNGHRTMMPRVYLADRSRSAADASRRQGGAVVASGGAVTIKTNGADVNLVNAGVQGKTVTVDAGQGNVTFSSTGGVRGGVLAEGEATLKGKDIFLAGGSVKGKDVNLTAARNLEVLGSLGYDDNGGLVLRENSPQVVAADQAIVKAERLATQGASLSAGKTLDIAAADVNLGAANEVDSAYSFTVHHGMGEAFAALSQTINTEQSASANERGSTLAADKLKVNTSGDLTITGGAIQAGQSDIEVGRNLTLKAAASNLWAQTKNDTREIFASASAGAAGFQAEAKAGTEQGITASTSRGTKAGAFAGYGFNIRSEEATLSGKVHSNGQLDVGSGSIKVAGTADLGGADINSDRFKNEGKSAGQDKLTISAGDIKTTKAVDVINNETSYSSFTSSPEAYVNSSLLTTISRFGDMIGQAVDEPGRQVDPLLAVGMVATEATQLIFADTAATGVTNSLSGSWGNKSSTSTRENTQKFGGNIDLVATQGDINLKGAQFAGGQEVGLDAKGAVTLDAAKSTTKSFAQDHSVTVAATLNAGANAAMATAGVGFTGTISGNHSVTNEDGTTFQNASIDAGQVRITSGGDTTLRGATIKTTGATKIASGGSVIVESLQDQTNVEKNGGSWTIGASASFNTKTKLAVAPTAGFTVEHHHQREKVVKTQSGISSGGALDVMAKDDINLKGAHLLAQGGQSSIKAGGKIRAEEIKDVTDVDGGKGGLSVGLNTTTGMVMLNGQYARDKRDHREVINKATIDVGDPASVKAAHGTSGPLNTDGKNLTQKTVENLYAGGESEVSIALGSFKRNNVVEDVRPSRRDSVDGGDRPPPPWRGPTPTIEPEPIPGIRDNRPTAPPVIIVDEVTRPPIIETVKHDTRPKPKPQPGPKPKPEPKPKPKPQPKPKLQPKSLGGRYEVQKQVKVAQTLVSKINLMQDVRGKLKEPVTLTFETPDGPKTFKITKREQVMNLNNMVVKSKPAQGPMQRFKIHVEDVGGKNYRLTYRTE